MRTLITGMSGTGKSTLTMALATRGYHAVDLDAPAWSEYRTVPGGGREWIWRDARVRELLEAPAGDPFVVSGCASNQRSFYPFFDEIVLLTAPLHVMLARLATRTTNNYGKSPEDLKEVIENHRTIEPLLRNVATREIDTTAPLEECIARIVSLTESR